MTKTVACYVRVSTVSQNEAGQRAEIERWLAGNGIDPASVRWFIDKGKSGDNLSRPAFAKLVHSIFMGEVGSVVVYKLDRLSRSLRDGIVTLTDWIDRGLRVVATSQCIDFNGTSGRIIAAVLLGIGEMEQENRRERQAVGIREAKAQGKYKGRAPGTLKHANGPARAAELRARGLHVDEIARSLGVGRNTAFRYLRQSKAVESNR
jgi:DNA invertase Pin-like site-specific DNA recombinase